MRISYGNKAVEIYETTIYPAPYLERKVQRYIIIDGKSKGEVVISDPETDVVPVIRPISLNMTAQCKSNSITVKIDKPCNFAIDFNSFEIFVFAYGDIEIDKKQFKNIICFEKGIHNPGLITIEDDDTLIYAEHGAIVNGCVVAKNVSNITMAGTGVFTMEKYERGEDLTHIAYMDHCKNVCVRDLTFCDSSNWTMVLWSCENAEINNLKIIGHRGNSDGIDVCSSKNVHVKNCFTRVWDDSFVVKSLGLGDSENIVFEDSTLWNDFARPIEVGVELRCECVKNIYFKNIDIINSPTGYPVLGIHHGDRAEVYDIRFEDIRIERAPGAQIFDMRITDSVWNHDEKKGNIHDIYLKDISVLTQEGACLSKSRIAGFDIKSDIKNVFIENLCICGAYARNNEEAGLIIDDYVENVCFSAKEPYLDVVNTEFNIIEDFTLVNNMYKGKVEFKMKNTADKVQNVNCSLKVVPTNSGYFDIKNINEKIEGHNEKSVICDVYLKPGKHCIHLESDYSNVEYSWKYINIPLMLPEKAEDGILIQATNCRNEYCGDIRLALKDENLIVKSELVREGRITLYFAKLKDIQPNEVVFSVEETDVGKAPAVINGPHGLEPAPQLRCPAEITYVFKNEPVVESLVKKHITKRVTNECIIPLENVKIASGDKKFWLEIEVETENLKRYPMCVFGSQQPEEICHMFCEILK